jgi:choline kinase
VPQVVHEEETMIDPYIQITLTDKQLYLLTVAIESKIKWFEEEVARIERKTGTEWAGGDIEEWDVNDIGVLQMTLQEFKKIQESRRNKA